MSTAVSKLSALRKEWRKNHPEGFTAKLEKNPDGTLNLTRWQCTIPGLPGTDWEGGLFKLRMYFTEHYPGHPPHCKFETKLFHPTIFPDGSICYAFLYEGDWNPDTSMEQLLVHIQKLLAFPLPAVGYCQPDAYLLFKDNREAYNERVRQQTLAMTPKEEPQDDPQADPQDDPQEDPQADPQDDPQEDPQDDPQEDPQDDPQGDLPQESKDE